MAEVNSFSKDSKTASADLLPAIIWGVRAAALLIPYSPSITFLKRDSTFP